MSPSTPQRWKRSCWPGIGSSVVNWTASGHAWATRAKKVFGDCRKRPILAPHTDRYQYGHPPARSSGDRQKASQQVFETLKQRGHPDAPSPLVSDGWGGVDEAIIEVYGAVPAYTGVGRPEASAAGLAVSASGQTAPERPSCRNDIARGLRQRSWRCWARAIERTHLTMRIFNGRLMRKTLAFSKLVAMCATWEDLVYNLARPLRLENSKASQRWLPRSPAMVAGLCLDCSLGSLCHLSTLNRETIYLLEATKGFCHSERSEASKLAPNHTPAKSRLRASLSC